MDSGRVLVSSDGNPKRNRLRICQPLAKGMRIHVLKWGVQSFSVKKVWASSRLGVRGPKVEISKFGDFAFRETSWAFFDRKIHVGFALRAMF